MTSSPFLVAGSLWELGGLTPGQLGRAVFEEIDANNVFGRAAELAFYFLFGLFPLIFLMMTLLVCSSHTMSNFKTNSYLLSQVFFRQLRSNF